MKIKNHYDVILCGGNLGSYLLAALLAKTGKQILLVDSDQGAFDRFSGPFIFHGLDPQGAFCKILNEIGLLNLDQGDVFSQLESFGFKKIDVPLQVLTPEYRSRIFDDFEETKKEIYRNAGNALGEKFDEFFSYLEILFQAKENIPDFVFQSLLHSQVNASEVYLWKKKLGGFYSKSFEHTPVPIHKLTNVGHSFFSSILGTSGFLMPYNLSCEVVLRSLSLFFSGSYTYRNGIAGLKEKIKQKIINFGGDIKFGATAKALIVDQKKITGILSSSFEGIVHANVIVLGENAKEIYLSLPESIQIPSVVRSLRRIEPAAFEFSFQIEIPETALPIGMTKNMVYVNSFQHDLLEENFIRIQVLNNSEYKSSTLENVTVLVSALVAYRDSSMDLYFLRQLGGKMLRVVAEVIPFLEKNMVSIFPDFRNSAEVLKPYFSIFGKNHNSQYEKFVPEKIYYYVRGSKEAQDFWGSNWNTPHRNLFFSGPTVWPSLGAYGEALAAWKIYGDLRDVDGK